MASPTAIKAFTGRLRFQLDEPNISFDPLINSGRDTQSAPGMRRLCSCWSVPILCKLRVSPQELECVGPAEGRGDFWLVEPSPLAVSVEASEEEISIGDTGKVDWRHAIESSTGQLRVRATRSADSARRSRVTLRQMVRCICTCGIQMAVSSHIRTVARRLNSLAETGNGVVL
jgi:hypothetical protein